jgi:hypothetical protein
MADINKDLSAVLKAQSETKITVVCDFFAFRLTRVLMRNSTPMLLNELEEVF